MCQVVLAQERLLVIDGSGLAIARRETPIAEEVQQAAANDGHKFGVTIQIKARELKVTLRAGPPLSIKVMSASVPLDATQHDRLMTGHMAVVGKDGYPVITPFIDDARRMPPDLTKPAPANRWRFAGEKELYRLYRATWRLKELAPPSLNALRESMLAAVAQDEAVQKAALEIYAKSIAQVVLDVQEVSDPTKAAAAAAELLGASSQPSGAEVK